MWLGRSFKCAISYTIGSTQHPQSLSYPRIWQKRNACPPFDAGTFHINAKLVQRASESYWGTGRSQFSGHCLAAYEGAVVSSVSFYFFSYCFWNSTAQQNGMAEQTWVFCLLRLEIVSFPPLVSLACFEQQGSLSGNSRGSWRYGQGHSSAIDGIDKLCENWISFRGNALLGLCRIQTPRRRGESCSGYQDSTQAQVLTQNGKSIMALNLIIHYDPAIFGEDTGLFRCDCFLITDPDSGKPPTLLNDGKLIDPFTVFGRRNHSCPRTSIHLQWSQDVHLDASSEGWHSF